MVYQWQSTDDTFERQDDSDKLFDKLELLAGLERDEIEDSLEDRQEILEWMVENEVNTVDRVGRVIAEFYQDEEHVMELVRSEKDPDDLFQ